MQRRRAALVIEDDPKTAAIVKLYLEGDGFAVRVEAEGRAGLESARRVGFDLIVLDMMLPGLDGFALCRRLREHSEAPVIVLTARVSEEDKIAGLMAGADDYVTKPFSPRELMARVRAVLRRSAPHGSRRRRLLRFEGLSLDARSREVAVDGRVVELTSTEFDLLETFSRAPGIALTRSQLVERAFGHDYEGGERTIDAHIANLRKKIARHSGEPLIETVFKVGYKFVARERDA
jgi:DNA-binding response OmpR family regulator